MAGWHLAGGVRAARQWRGEGHARYAKVAETLFAKLPRLCRQHAACGATGCSIRRVQTGTSVGGQPRERKGRARCNAASCRSRTRTAVRHARRRWPADTSAREQRGLRAAGCYATGTIRAALGARAVVHLARLRVLDRQRAAGAASHVLQHDSYGSVGVCRRRARARRAVLLPLVPQPQFSRLSLLSLCSPYGGVLPLPFWTRASNGSRSGCLITRAQGAL